MESKLAIPQIIHYIGEIYTYKGHRCSSYDWYDYEKGEQFFIINLNGYWLDEPEKERTLKISKKDILLQISRYRKLKKIFALTW